MAVVVLGRTLDAFLFDLDGVVTRTATLHAHAWKRLFDEFLSNLDGDPERFAAFRLPEDYLAYVDGKPRYEGVRAFLQARAIELPWGDPEDSPGRRPSAGSATARTGTSTRSWPGRASRCFPPRSL